MDGLRARERIEESSRLRCPSVRSRDKWRGVQFLERFSAFRIPGDAFAKYGGPDSLSQQPRRSIERTAAQRDRCSPRSEPGTPDGDGGCRDRFADRLLRTCVPYANGWSG